MPITELATPSLKQDEASRLLFTNTLWPMLASIVNGKEGLKLRTIGLMLLSNGLDVSSVFQPVLGLEWESLSAFQAIVASDEFIEFMGRIIPIATAVVGPELYDTDVGPGEVYGSPLTEVFKVEVGHDEQKKVFAKNAWADFVKGTGAKKTLSGLSVNLEERKFVGMIGWESIQERDTELNTGVAVELRGKFESSETLLLKFGGL